MNDQIIAHLRKDKRLVPLIDAIELTALETDGDVYRALTRSIVSQQLSTKAAATIYGRFLDLFEDRYPHRSQVLEFSIEELRAIGLSRQKANYIQNVAVFFNENKIVDWDAMSDEVIIAYLTTIKGIGQWTVEMILIFTLNRLDVLPLDDLAIKNGMIKRYEVTETGRYLKPALTEIASHWQPYRSIACRYLWRWGDIS